MAPPMGIERTTWNNPLLTTFVREFDTATLWVLWCFKGNSQVKLRARDPFPHSAPCRSTQRSRLPIALHGIRHYYTWLLRGLVFRAPSGSASTVAAAILRVLRGQSGRRLAPSETPRRRTLGEPSGPSLIAIAEIGGKTTTAVNLSRRPRRR